MSLTTIHSKGFLEGESQTDEENTFDINSIGATLFDNNNSNINQSSMNYNSMMFSSN